MANLLGIIPVFIAGTAKTVGFLFSVCSTTNLTNKGRLFTKFIPFVSLFYSCLFSVASSANSSISHLIGVFRRILMSLRAVGLAAIYRCNSYSPQNIFTKSNNFHMTRINTSPISTEMVNRHIERDFSNHQFIGESVSSHMSLPINIKLPISATTETPYPIPTIGFFSLINFSPKSINRVHRQKLPSNFIFHTHKYNTGDYSMSTGGV